MGSSLKLVGAILIACLAASVGLGATYSVTRERIVEQERIREEASLRDVLPDADSFERVEDADALDAADEVTDGDFVALYRALGPGGELIGWGVRVAPRGYGGPIQMAVGLERDGKVTGASIVSMNETPGLGTKIGDDEFLAQFVGWASASIEDDAKTLDAISGATKSSNGIRKGLLAAGHVYESVVSGIMGGAGE